MLLELREQAQEQEQEQAMAMAPVKHSMAMRRKE